MKFLITGGAGYIGSTIASALTGAGHTPVIMDSLITGRKEFTAGHIFYQADIADKMALTKIFQDHPDIFATVHCAALIVVPESVTMPYEYYLNNVSKSIELFHNLQELGCHRIVFSSSAALSVTGRHVLRGRPPVAAWEKLPVLSAVRVVGWDRPLVPQPHRISHRT